MNTLRPRSLRPWQQQALRLCLILAVVVAAYAPGLNGPFVFDDFYNIVNNPAIAMNHLSWPALLAAARADQSGYLPRWLPMVSLAIDHYIAGGFDHTLPFKLTNLLIHLINTTLVYAIAARLARRLRGINDTWLPPLVAALWALHPIQLTSVLYVVQRMASLSALFVFSGLLLYLVGRERLARKPRQAWAMMAAGLLGGILLGIGCKENAVLLPLLALATELTLYHSYEPGTGQKRTVQILFALLLGIPALTGAVWLAMHPEFLVGGYVQRDFTLVQRLLTETRVLWYYLSLLIAPIPARFTIYHDDFVLSTGLFHPATTAVSILAWLATAAAAWRWRRRAPELGLGLLWFLSAQALESSAIGLELVHEHRNYVASLGPLFMGVALVARLPLRVHSTAWRHGLILAFIVSASVSTLSRAAIWRSDDSLIPSLVHNHPQSARNQSIMAEYLLHRRRDPLGAMVHFRRAAQLRPRHADALLEIARIAMQTRIDLPSGRDRPQLPPALEDVVYLVPSARNQARYNLRPKPSLVREIDARLESAKIGTDTSYQLGRLTDCTTLAPRPCASLAPDIRKWYRLAIENPVTRPIARAWLALGLARLELDTGHPKHALRALEIATGLRTQQAEYWLLTAQGSLRVGRRQQAQAALRRLHDPVWKLDPTQLASRERLEKALATAAARQR